MKLTVAKTDAPERLDIFLTAKLPNATRSFVARQIKAGGVTVNGSPTVARYKPKPGDIIEVSKAEQKEPALAPDPNVAFTVMDERADFLVVEKPANVVVHPALGVSEPTLADGLVAKYPELADVGENSLRPGIVHRLDRDVSGLMVIARTQTMFAALKRQFQDRTVEKQYTALVHGVIQEDRGTIDTPIGRSKTTTGKMAAHTQGLDGDREAKTDYTVLARLKNHTLLLVDIHTGRSHQIRVHLHSIEHPVVGDTLYTNRRVKHKDLGRIFLHASKLSFEGADKAHYTYESPLPKELQTFYETLN
ncbi:MAG: RluA family pseudouridine synthase [Patescibacteria group bacterium]|nr:RluA family pseudouridine synthase [Patescibacteria group bacterium]